MRCSQWMGYSGDDEVAVSTGAQTKGSYCYAHLPRAGLGNMLLVWARALVYAHLTGSVFMTSSWTKLRVGPILRGERSRRWYGGCFKDLQNTNRLVKLWVLWTYHRIEEPTFEPAQRSPSSRTLYVFNEIPHWRDYFGAIRGHRELVREKLYEAVSDRYLESLNSIEPPVVGVHVRRGDFRELQPGEDFAKVGLVRTPLSYFQDLIRSIRTIHGSEVPVTIFSDGYDQDLADLLTMPNVRRASDNPDIVDLLLLSKSGLIVASAGSTFGYWAGFLADAPLILHPDHIHAPIRPGEVNARYFEGSPGPSVEGWPALLKQNIRAL